MKKLCFLFAVLLLSALLFALPTAAADSVVYLANGGDGDGSSAAAPLGSLNSAYAALGDDGGTIVVCGAYTLGNTSPLQLPAHTGKVTFTSLYDDVDYRTSGAELTFNGTSFVAFNGPTDFDDLNMHVTGSAAGICANFNDMTIGHGVEILGAKATTYYMYLIGGPNNNSAVAPLAAGKTFRLSVYSGKFHTMSGFSRNNANASHLGTAIVTIGGDADVSAFCGGPLSSGAKGGTAIINLEDAAAIKTFYLGGYNCAAMSGDLTLNVSGTAKVTTISNYNETYFATTQKILNTVGNSFSLPAGYADIFDRITVDGVQVKPATDASVFYVCDGGTGDGTSALSPAGALADAYAALPYGGTVVICGAYTLGNTSTLTLPAISGEMTITSRFGDVDYRESGAKLIFNGTNFLKLSSATVFDALTMTLDGSMAGICANFHPVTVTESVSVIRTSGSTAYSMIFVVGTSGDKTNSLGAGEILEMNINGGKFTSCTAFTRQVATSNAGTVILNIGGNADVRDLVGGTLSTTAARAGSAVINLSGNAHVTNFYLGGYSSAGMQGDTVVNIGGDVSITKIANYDENFYPASEKYLNLFTDSATLPSGFADCFDYVTTASENAAVKFVRGEATGSGATPFAPTGSIASAYAALPAGGKIVVMGGATFENASTLQLPAHTGTVTLTSVYGGMDFRTLADAKVGYTGTAFVCFNGDTILDDLTVDIGSFASEGFCFNFHNGTLGEGFEIIEGTGYHFIVIAGADNDPNIPALAADAEITLTIESGKYHTVSGFTRHMTDISHLGSVTVNIGGDALIDAYCVGPISAGARGGNAIVDLYGDAVVNKMYLGGYNCDAMNGDVTVNIADAARIGKFFNYGADYFTQSEKILHILSEDVSLPANHTEVFDVITPTTCALNLSGVYTDGESKLRFVTGAEAAQTAPEVEYFGTYIVPLSYFTEHELSAGGDAQVGVAMVKYTQDIAGGTTFAADLINIPESHADTPIFVWSFIKFSGIDTVYTEALGTFTLREATLVKGGF